MNIIISGSSKGLGLELANGFLFLGHNVIGLSRGNNPSIQHPNYLHFALDIADRKKVIEASEKVGHKTIDIIINNAGLPGTARKISEVDTSEVQALLNVNLFGVINIVQAFLEKFKLGNEKRIINISSRFGSLSFNQEEQNRKMKISYSYRIAKAAQNMLAVCLANELNEFGVSVDVIHPGSFHSNCNPKDTIKSSGEIAKTILEWIFSGQRPQETRMREIGVRDFDW